MAIVWQQASWGTDKKYEFEFSFQSSVTVTHNLKKKPAVTVIDSAGSLVIWKVNYVTNNELVVTFSAPFSWIITCN